MRYEEIIPSIILGKNKFEEERGIMTKKIEEWRKFEDIAFFKGFKSDNTITFFVGLKKNKYKEDSWDWFCPSKNQCEIFSTNFKFFFDCINLSNKEVKL